MIADVFNHQLFWEKQGKNINSLFCALFKKRLSFCCFDSYVSQILLSIRTMTLRSISSMEKKTTEAKKGF